MVSQVEHYQAFFQALTAPKIKVKEVATQSGSVLVNTSTGPLWVENEAGEEETPKEEKMEEESKKDS